MGLKKTKVNNKNISKYTKISIPDGYIKLKISSYNINIKNTINLSTKIKNIMIFIMSLHKEQDTDIVCLQGINDYKAAIELVKEIKRYMGIYNINFYFAPEFDDIHVTIGNALSANLYESVPKIKSIKYLSADTKKTKNAKVQNIIISKYPIISSIYSILGDNSTNVTNIKTVIGANISVYNSIISVYCTEMSEDFDTVNFDNRLIRENEFDKLVATIKDNINKLVSSNNFSNFKLSDIHFIVGTLNVNDTYIHNDEYINMLQKYKIIDIFRCLYNYEENMGYTTIYNKRIDYICMYLTDDIYDNNSKYYNEMQNIDSTKKLLNLLFNRYSIHFIDYHIVTLQHYFSDNYPVEMIFMYKYINNSN